MTISCQVTSFRKSVSCEIVSVFTPLLLFTKRNHCNLFSKLYKKWKCD